MQISNVPTLGWRYWIMISIASVFGANMGDFVSHELHLGHVRGVPILAMLFAVVWFLERRAKVPTELYYWLAIVVLRTAATNLADFATHDLRLTYEWVIAALAVLLTVVAAFGPKRSEKYLGEVSSVPKTDIRYWITMLIAGTLGTAFGDFCADDLGLTASSMLFVALLVLTLAAARHAAARFVAAYWLTIVLVRTAGTNVGDFLADGDGIGLGLWISTISTGAVFALVMLAWKPRPAQTLQENLAT